MTRLQQSTHVLGRTTPRSDFSSVYAPNIYVVRRSKVILLSVCRRLYAVCAVLFI
jgi:hypothetical protein